MKFFILFLGIASSFAAPHGKFASLSNMIFYNSENYLTFWKLLLYAGLPSFKISGYSRSNVPEMSVTLQNGDAHEMVLEPYSESPCNFIGHLKDVPSTLAVTGCINKPGDKMHITLLSKVNTASAMYEFDFDGQVSALENPFKHQKGLYFWTRTFISKQLLVVFRFSLRVLVVLCIGFAPQQILHCTSGLYFQTRTFISMQIRAVFTFW